MTYHKNTIIFVTAFKDINRQSWHVIPKTTEEYINEFLMLARNIKYKLIVFIEKNLLEKLQTYNLNSNIELIDSSIVETFYDKYIVNEKIMINSEEYKNKIPNDRKNAPEHWCAEYNMVNHSKINYIAYTKKLYPAYEYYSWLDFGCIRNGTIEHIPHNIDFNKLQQKITYLAITLPPDIKISANDMLKSHTIYLAGSQFITHHSLVEKHELLYSSILEEWKKNIICDEDQGAILQIYFENKELFHLIPIIEWFSLFKNYFNSNIKVDNKNDIHSIININNYTGTYAEIGVARGTFTKYILNNTMLIKLLLIDPYKNFTKDEYTDGMNYYDMEFEFNMCKTNLADYNNRIEFIRKCSSDAISDILDGSLDVVYIDGNHAYSYVMEDLKNYWPKLRSGGIMFGDDVYEYSEDKDVLKLWDNKSIDESISFGKYGVHAAVIDFCNKMKLHFLIFSNQFMIYKP